MGLEYIHCHECGKPSPIDARFCRYCGANLDTRQSKPIRKNRYDESVKEWFTSKTFRTIVTVGLVGGCSFAICTLLYYSSLVGLLGTMFSIASQSESSVSTVPSSPDQFTQPARQMPYIVGSTNENNPIDENTKAILNAWLATSAPVDTPYWFVTHWQREEDGRIFVSLAGLRLSYPEEKWTLIPDDEHKVVWIGSVEIIGNAVRMYP